MLSNPKNMKPVDNTEPVYNNLVQQFVRNLHLTFNQKWRDEVEKTYGHEAPVDNNDTANTEHCIVFNADVERLNEIKWEHLAGRKLWNPFKHLEFLLVFPLELLSWSSAKLFGLLKDPITLHIYLGVNLAVNITTGLLRRILAPARYIIRPSIETAKNYPITFGILLGLTILIGLSPILALQLGLPFTGIFGFFFGAGYAPILLASLIFGFKAALTMTFTLINAPVAAMMLASVTAWTFLLKCANTLWDIVNGISAILKMPEDKDQLKRIRKLNNNKNDPLYFMTIHKGPDLEALKKDHPDKCPLLIVNKQAKQAWVYGLTQEGKAQLKPDSSGKLFNLVDSYKAKQLAHEQELAKLKKSINPEEQKENENKIKLIEAELFEIQTIINQDNSTPYKTFSSHQLYIEVRRLHLHFPAGKGSTTAIAQSLHAMDPVHTDIKPVKEQEQVRGYKLALFTGTESIFFSARPQEHNVQEVKSEAKSEMKSFSPERSNRQF